MKTYVRDLSLAITVLYNRDDFLCDLRNESEKKHLLQSSLLFREVRTVFEETSA